MRFEKVLTLVPAYLSPEFNAQFRAIPTPANIGIFVGSLAAWAVSHAFDAGEIVDVILLGVGAFFVGMGIFKDLGDCLMGSEGNFVPDGPPQPTPWNGGS